MKNILSKITVFLFVLTIALGINVSNLCLNTGLQKVEAAERAYTETAHTEKVDRKRTQLVFNTLQGPIYTTPKYITQAKEEVNGVMMEGYNFPIAVKLTEEGRKIFCKYNGENEYDIVAAKIQIRFDSEGNMYKKIVKSNAKLKDGSTIMLPKEVDSVYKNVSKSRFWKDIYDRKVELYGSI